MNERETNDHDFNEHWGGHPHRHHGGRRFRARFGPPVFDQGAEEPGMPARPGRPGRTRSGPEGPSRPGRAERAERPERGEFGGRGGFGGDFGPEFPASPGFHGGPPGFGSWSRGYGRRGGRRAKRGDVRAAALALLAEEPMNGYQIIQQISDRSGGLWRPSPGSVYPALAQLEDEGLIVLQATAGERRAYALTEAGRSYVAEHADELKAPWSAVSGDAASAAADLHSLVRQVHFAAFGVLSAGAEDSDRPRRARSWRRPAGPFTGFWPRKKKRTRGPGVRSPRTCRRMRFLAVTSAHDWGRSEELPVSTRASTSTGQPSASQADGGHDGNRPPVIAVSALTKRYGEIEAVAASTSRCARGEIFGFLGPNGAGKTTTINMLCTLADADGGQRAGRGLDVVARARRRSAATSASSSRTRRSTAT